MTKSNGCDEWRNERVEVQERKMERGDARRDEEGFSASSRKISQNEVNRQAFILVVLGLTHGKVVPRAGLRGTQAEVPKLCPVVIVSGLPPRPSELAKGRFLGPGT